MVTACQFLRFCCIDDALHAMAPAVLKLLERGCIGFFAHGLTLVVIEPTSLEIMVRLIDEILLQDSYRLQVGNSHQRIIKTIYRIVIAHWSSSNVIMALDFVLHSRLEY